MAEACTDLVTATLAGGRAGATGSPEGAQEEVSTQSTYRMGKTLCAVVHVTLMAVTTGWLADSKLSGRQK